MKLTGQHPGLVDDAVAKARETVNIRTARPSDEAGLAALLREMEQHYGDDTPAASAAALAAHLVSSSAGATHTLVAESGNSTLVGFAICTEYWPADHLTKGFLLKDLFVSAGARSGGIGRRLLDHVAAHARKLGCTRVHWTTGARNVRAQRLYDAIGARREEKVYYVVEADLLDEMAQRANRSEAEGS